MNLLSLHPRLRIIPLLAAAAALSGPTAIFGQIRLEVVPIKHEDSFIWDTLSINHQGQIAGELYSPTDISQRETAIWQRDAETRLIESPLFHSPHLINDSGTIVGYRGYKLNEHDSSPSYDEAYIWSEEAGYQYISTTQFHGSGALPTVRPSDLSNSGFAVGYSSTLDATGSYVAVTKGWIWSNQNGISEIPRLAEGFGFEETRPSSVNDDGIVVGTYGYAFHDSGSHTPGAFIYDAANGTRALSEVDAAFFNDHWVQPHDINNSNRIVGTTNINGVDYAFVYDLDERSGTSFSGFGTDPTHGPAGAQAASVNSLGIVIGIAGDFERASPDEDRKIPFIWSSKYGIKRLADVTTVPIGSLLPAGHDIDDAQYLMRSINDHGQMLGTVYNFENPTSQFEIPFALYPILDYRFQLKAKVARPEGDLLVFAHSKQLDEGTLSPSHFGKTIVHESSADAKTWRPLEHGVDGVEIVDQEDELQLRLPERSRVFLRSRLTDAPASTN